MGKPVIDYSGDDATLNRDGIAIIMEKDIAEAVLGFTPISDRVALLKMNLPVSIMNIIEGYAPTTQSCAAEIENFHQTLEDALKLTKKTEVNIVIGNFNATIGQGTVPSITIRLKIIHKEITSSKDIRRLKERNIQDKVKEELNKNFAKRAENYIHNLKEQYNKKRRNLS